MNEVAKTPLEEYELAKIAARDARKQKEVDQWRTWKENGYQAHHLQPLLKAYEGTIAQKTKMWKAPAVPASAFKLVLQERLIDAFKSYDPSRGAALNTHVENRLQRAKRYNTRMQNVAYIPEGPVSKIGPINSAIDTLQDELNRAPTNAEIADHLGMSEKHVETVRKSQRRDIASSSLEFDPTEHGMNYEEEQLEIAANILPHIFPNKPHLQTVFNHVFGKNGAEQITSTTALAKKMNVTPQQLARYKTNMGNALREHMGLDSRKK